VIKVMPHVQRRQSEARRGTAKRPFDFLHRVLLVQAAICLVAVGEGILEKLGDLVLRLGRVGSVLAACIHRRLLAGHRRANDVINRCHVFHLLAKVTDTLELAVGGRKIEFVLRHCFSCGDELALQSLSLAVNLRSKRARLLFLGRLLCNRGGSQKGTNGSDKNCFSHSILLVTRVIAARFPTEKIHASTADARSSAAERNRNRRAVTSPAVNAIAATSMAVGMPTRAATAPQVALPAAMPPCSTNRYSDNMRARTHAGDMVWADTFRLA